MNVSKNFLLIPSSALLRKRVVRISRPPSRKSAAIVGVRAPGHSDFVAVVQFWNATQRHDQPERQLQLCGRTAFGAREARHVMVREEGDERIRARVQGIVSQNI